MILDAPHLAGYLIWCDAPAQTRLKFEASPALYCLENRTLWFHHYIYETAEPILRVDDPHTQPPYEHQIIICWGQSGLLALGSRHHVIDHLLSFELGSRLRTAWRRSTINVQSLIERRLKFDPGADPKPAPPPLSDYDISHLSAKTESYRGLLRSLSLYGDNVVHAPFLGRLGAIECTSCTLRNDSGEVISIGSDGYISFRVPREATPQTSRLREIMAILAELRDKQLLTL
jgi:hypothetical protein